jgi:hypothetical protein
MTKKKWTAPKVALMVGAGAVLLGDVRDKLFFSGTTPVYDLSDMPMITTAGGPFTRGQIFASYALAAVPAVLRPWIIDLVWSPKRPKR